MSLLDRLLGRRRPERPSPEWDGPDRAPDLTPEDVPSPQRTGFDGRPLPDRAARSRSRLSGPGTFAGLGGAAAAGGDWGGGGDSGGGGGGDGGGGGGGGA